MPVLSEDTRRLVTIRRLEDVDLGRVFSWVTLSARTNVPYFGLQVKYRLPLTEPSFLPVKIILDKIIESHDLYQAKQVNIQKVSSLTNW